MLHLMCIPIFFAVASVTSSAISSENHYDVKRLVRDVYKYNHPPSAFSVPVAIVYEDGNQQVTSVQSEVRSPKSDDQDVNEVTTTEATTLTDITTNKILKAHFRVSDEINTESYFDHEYTIPVAVIYDDEPKSTSITPKDPNNSKLKNRQQRERKVVKSNKENTKKKTELMPDQDNTASTKYPKRTEGRDPIVPILQSDNYVFSHSGDYHYSYESGDGTKAFMKGELRSIDDANAGTAVEGGFSYIGKDGNDYSLSYTADENGYRPIGAHLPTPPPIPPAIARALKYLATKTTPQPVTESLKVESS